MIRKILTIFSLILLINSCSHRLKFIGEVSNKKDVTIYRDEWGVPHIYGKKDTDVAYGLAYANAEDDIDNIIFSLMAGRGKLGEYYGKNLASSDFLVQLIGLWDNLEQNYHLVDKKTIQLCNAYADGINNFLIKNQPKNIPLSVFPVTGKDLIAGFMHKTPFFYGLDKIISQVIADEYPKDYKMYSYFPNIYGESMGSNVFAVSPKRSESGSTHLMSNTHQPWDGPTAWYEAHLHSEEGWNTVGGLFPGSPIILVGHNENLGWSHTVNQPDLIDVYELDFDEENSNFYIVDGEAIELEEVQISFKVKLFGPIKININKIGYRTIFGPVFESKSGKKYVIKFQGMDDPRVVEQWYKMNKAQNFDEWKSAMEMMAIPSFNTGYADKYGNIFYVYNAKLPNREPGYNWSELILGNTKEVMWNGSISFEELPQLFNPQSGFIQNCNSTPFKTTIGNDNPKKSHFPKSYGIETIMTNRAIRSLELFGNDSLISTDEIINYKYDLKYSPQSNIAGIIKKTNDIETENPLLISAINILNKWNLETSIDNPYTAFAIFSLYDFLEIKPNRINLHELSNNILSTAKKFKKWHGSFEVPWGDVNRLVRGKVNLPLNGGPDINHAIYGIPQKNGKLKAIAGDCYIIYAEWDKSGNIISKSIHQYGSTQNEKSNHYNSQALLFSKKKMKDVYFYMDDVKKNAIQIYNP